MSKMNHSAKAMLVAASLLACASSSYAATAVIHADRANFLNALGGASTFTQDFEGYATGTNMSGVEFLPGVTASTNLSSIEVFQGTGDKELFIQGRNQPTAEYEILVGGNYRAMGFDIDAFNPATSGPGFLSFYFTDGDITYTGIPVLPLNPTENDPLFFGVISDTPITRILWSEGPEIDGSCCEETALDNFVASPVPIPAAGWLMLSGLGALASLGVRRRSAGSVIATS